MGLIFDNDVLTPEIMVAVMTVAGKLMGYGEDVEEVMNGLVDEGRLTIEYNRAPRAFFTALDKKVWKCVECDIWHPPHELNAKEYCVGCAPCEED